MLERLRIESIMLNSCTNATRCIGIGSLSSMPSWIGFLLNQWKNVALHRSMLVLLIRCYVLFFFIDSLQKISFKCQQCKQYIYIYPSIHPYRYRYLLRSMCDAEPYLYAACGLHFYVFHLSFSRHIHSFRILLICVRKHVCARCIPSPCIDRCMVHADESRTVKQRIIIIKYIYKKIPQTK